ncbi:CAP domain-containing protein [Rhodopseudomonas sp. HC1]|uniref:CAP domain-containing protein n=1 Tax=Rhodopseudomonas infernalis TaxID=2897386 RepID=UPI001EE94338|nr:CAP domain-containing protein [Rhodopseudomonas infernalis]MCG6205905.1 CAP domain-containing protein [Rhodopseudomonas infernalis]
MTLILGVTFFASVVATPAFAAGPADLISEFRAKNGEGKVVMDATLNAIAQQQAAGMAAKDVLDHDVVGNFNNRVAPSKAGSAAENIAYGYDSFPKTLGQWINSPGHRRNLLLKGASKVGVANAKSASGRTYWAMVIAGGYDKPKPKPPVKPTKSVKTDAVAAKGAAKDKPAKPKPPSRDCTIKMLGLCF